MSTEPTPPDRWRWPKIAAFTLLYAALCYGVMQRLGPDPNISTRFLFVSGSLWLYYLLFSKLFPNSKP